MDNETTFIDRNNKLWFLQDIVETRSLLSNSCETRVFLIDSQGGTKHIKLKTLEKDYKQILCPHHLDYILRLDSLLENPA